MNRGVYRHMDINLCFNLRIVRIIWTEKMSKINDIILLSCYICQAQIISKFFASHTEKRGRLSWDKKNEKRHYKYKTNNNAAIYVGKFEILTSLMVIFTIYVLHLLIRSHEALIFMLFQVSRRGLGGSMS